MKKQILMMAALGISPWAWSAVKVNNPAPAFSEKAADGSTYSLDKLKGKWVVLEWYNKDCPYVKKHYGSENMQKLQKEYTEKDIVWLTVNSSAEGKQGYLDAKSTLKDMKSSGTKATATLIDSDGSMGKAYGAKTTPHMYIIDPEGKIVYHGAIDDNDSANPETIAKAKNYVRLALTEAMAGKKVNVASSKPYGCSVKYN